MVNLTYSVIIKNSKRKEVVRKKMVERYREVKNYSQVAREYGATRKTVARWVERYKKKGAEGLRDRSRAPNSIPHKTPEKVEKRIEEIVKSKKLAIGQDRVQVELEVKEGIHLSTSTINRVMNEKGLIKKRRKKWKKKKQISKWRKKLEALRYFEVDVKDLSDIPNIFALVHEGIIPRYEYTARDVVTGVTFISFAWRHSMVNSVRFAREVFEHLKGFGIHSSEVTVQTDNGSEFIGAVFAKEPSVFETLIEKNYNAYHKTIPVGKKEWQGIVETFYKGSEKEHFDVCRFDSLDMFMGKAWSLAQLEQGKIGDTH